MKVEKQKIIAFQIIFGKTMMNIENNAKKYLDKNTRLNLFEKLLKIQKILNYSDKHNTNLICDTMFFHFLKLNKIMFKENGDYFYRENIKRELVPNKIELDKYFNELTEEEIFNNLKIYYEKFDLKTEIFLFYTLLKFVIKTLKENQKLINYI